MFYGFNITLKYMLYYKSVKKYIILYISKYGYCPTHDRSVYMQIFSKNKFCHRQHNVTHTRMKSRKVFLATLVLKAINIVIIKELNSIRSSINSNHGNNCQDYCL